MSINFGGNVIPIARHSNALSADLQEQFDRVGLDPVFLRQNLDTRGTILDTENCIASFTANPEALEVIGAAKKKAFKFSVYPDSEGSVEGLGHVPELAFGDHGLEEEYLQVAVSPTAMVRMVEPVASVTRALELVDPANTEDAGNQSVVRIGAQSLLSMGVSHAIFSDVARQLPDHEYNDRQVELSKIQPTIESETGAGLVDELALMFAGAVSMHFCKEKILQEFGHQRKFRDRIILADQVGLMLRSMAISRGVTGERSMRRRVSYGLERAFSGEQMTRVMDIWFKKPRS